MNRKMEYTLAGLAAAVLAMGSFTTVAGAQRAASRGGTSSAAKKSSATLGERTRGLSLGVYTLAAPGVSLTGEDIDGTFGTAFGPGAGLMVGYGFDKTWSAYASLDVAKQSTSSGTFPEGSLGLAHFELGARANLPINHPKILPYVNAAIGNRALAGRVYDEEEDDYYNESMSGGMVAFGGGAQYFLSPTMSLDGGLTIALGSLSKWTQDGDTETADVDGTRSIRLRFGVSWRPVKSASSR